MNEPPEAGEAPPVTGGAGGASTPQEVFSNSPEGLRLCHAVRDAILGAVPATERTTTSQVAFRNRRGFAYVWNPRRYLKTEVPAVLSIALSRRVESSRFKEVVHPSPGVWMHHLELVTADDIDEEVTAWLTEAFGAAA